MLESRTFSSSDIDLLVSVMSLVPNAITVAHAIKLSREHIRYPLQKQQLIDLIDKEEGVFLGEERITPENVQQFMLEEFFLIESEESLMYRLFMALQMGDLLHEAERAQAAVDIPMEHLVSGTRNDPAFVLNMLNKFGGQR